MINKNMPAKKSAKKKNSRAKVMHGNAEKTSGKLTKSQLKKNKKGDIVSIKKQKVAKKNLSPWLKAVADAKKELGIPKNKFVLLNVGSEGKALYKLAREIYDS